MITVAVGAVAAFAANAVGGLVGFASSLLLLPVLLVLGVPLWQAVSLNLVLAVATRLPSIVALRRDVNIRRTATMLVGSLPGMALGVAVAAAVPVGVLEVAAGVLVLLAGGYLAWSLRAAGATEPAPLGVSTGATALAGGCSGLLGVTTSLNGVPPVLLLSRAEPSVRVRLADLSWFFVIGNCLTVLVLAAGRGVTLFPEPVAAGVWLLAGIAGNAVGLWAARFLSVRRFDLITVALVLFSGTSALVGAVAH